MRFSFILSEINKNIFLKAIDLKVQALTPTLFYSRRLWELSSKYFFR